MALRRVLAVAVASAALVAGTAGAASAQTTQGTRVTAVAGSGDNNNASVAGVAGRPADGNPGDCPLGNFCLYTGTNYTGTMFPLYHCGTYSLSNWNGFGSAANNQTGGVAGRLLNRDGSTNLTVPATYGTPSWNYAPVWYAVPC